MTLKSLSLASLVFMFVAATNVSAAAPQAEPPSQKIDSREQLEKVYEMRRQAAAHEYDVRIAEFKAGRSPANVALQANRRLLHASLAADAPNAAIEYDRRASEIEAIAIKNLELGTGTRQEITQAESARLDGILKGLILHSNSRDN